MHVLWLLLLLGLGGHATPAPFFGCQEPLGGGLCRQWWGYTSNENATVPVGASNFFDPLPEDRGQATDFANTSLKLKQFSVDAGCDNVTTWTVQGNTDNTLSGRTCADLCTNGELLDYTIEVGTDASALVMRLALNASNVTHISINIPSCVNAYAMRITDCAWPCPATGEHACDDGILDSPARFCIDPACIGDELYDEFIPLVGFYTSEEADLSYDSTHAVFHTEYDCHECPVTPTIGCPLAGDELGRRELGRRALCGCATGLTAERVDITAGLDDFQFCEVTNATACAGGNIGLGTANLCNGAWRFNVSSVLFSDHVVTSATVSWDRNLFTLNPDLNVTIRLEDTYTPSDCSGAVLDTRTFRSDYVFWDVPPGAGRDVYAGDDWNDGNDGNDGNDWHNGHNWNDWNDWNDWNNRHNGNNGNNGNNRNNGNNWHNRYHWHNWHNWHNRNDRNNG